MIKLTFRQKVLLELLNYNEPTFRKRTFVPLKFQQREWKYCNSLVFSNCQWFGGTTTRKKSTERGKVHMKELGFDGQVRLIEHADRVYRLNKDNIRKYLLATISKKANFTSGLLGEIDAIEKEYNVKLRETK
jgi:hypothetical protein